MRGLAEVAVHGAECLSLSLGNKPQSTLSVVTRTTPPSFEVMKAEIGSLWKRHLNGVVGLAELVPGNWHVNHHDSSFSSKLKNAVSLLNGHEHSAKKSATCKSLLKPARGDGDSENTVPGEDEDIGIHQYCDKKQPGKI
ncbi:hypothetical protein EK904_006941 [Melospiza melodia maxima]|nr:hypothetical protein EK904_006941 [Melospiza melodia maxima]